MSAKNLKYKYKFIIVIASLIFIITIYFESKNDHSYAEITKNHEKYLKIKVNNSANSNCPELLFISISQTIAGDYRWDFQQPWLAEAVRIPTSNNNIYKLVIGKGKIYRNYYLLKISDDVDSGREEILVAIIGGIAMVRHAAGSNKFVKFNLPEECFFAQGPAVTQQVLKSLISK